LRKGSSNFAENILRAQASRLDLPDFFCGPWLLTPPSEQAVDGIKLFVIDYLQLLHSTSRRAENRQQEIADISNGIKALAKELKVPKIDLFESVHTI
jgi:hypothetical protein